MDKIMHAKDIIDKYYDNRNPSEEDDLEFVEALNYLIDTTGEVMYVTELGGFYYGKKRFDLALKYYSLAAEANDKYALNGLGYIYYYGRCGEVDYSKAFEYYKRAAELGVDEASMKLSDMYKNGYGTSKDEARAKNILYMLYDKNKNADNVYSILPEVSLRLSNYLILEEKYEEAYDLLYDAKRFVAHRLFLDPFFGEFTNMDSILNNMYKCVEFDPLDMDLFDLMYFYKANAGDVVITYIDDEYRIHGEYDGNSIAICFLDKWYRDIREFLMNAKIDGKRITSLYYYIYSVEEVA